MNVRKLLPHIAVFTIALAIGLSGVNWSQAAHTDRPDSSQKHYSQQGGTITNSTTTSATDTAVVVTITGVANQNVHLYSIDVICSAGTSMVTVDDGVTEIYSKPVKASPNQEPRRWIPPLTMDDGSDAVVTLATCGSGNTGTLIVQADRW